MMRLTSVVSLLLIVNYVYGVATLDNMKDVQTCQDSCKQAYVNDKHLLESCSYGCGMRILMENPTSEECTKNCKDNNNWIGSEKGVEKCIEGCLNSISQQVIQPIVVLPNNGPQQQQPAVDPAVEVPKKDDNSSEESKEDVASSSSEEQNDKDIGSLLNVLTNSNLFQSILNQGEPINANNVDDQSKPMIEKPQVIQSIPITNDENNLDDSTSVFGNIFKMFSMMKEGLMDKLDKTGGYFFRIQMFPNGTVVKTFQNDIKPEDQQSLLDPFFVDELPKSDDTSINVDQPIRIINADLIDENVNKNNDKKLINYKGIPLMIGKPIVEPFNPENDVLRDDDSTIYHFRMRECRPIKFQLSTLCHDINNLFTCASMRTGLPRWFFLSLVLLTSFIMIWLGVFILSALRRMRRRERIIIHHEEYLPLYKDIEVEKGEINNAYEAPELPVKVKIENI